MSFFRLSDQRVPHRQSSALSCFFYYARPSKAQQWVKVVGYLWKKKKTRARTTFSCGDAARRRPRATRVIWGNRVPVRVGRWRSENVLINIVTYDLTLDTGFFFKKKKTITASYTSPNLTCRAMYSPRGYILINYNNICIFCAFFM